MKNLPVFRVPLLMLALVGVLSGCAHLRHQSSEDAVRQRSDAFWAARMSNDVAKAYQYTSPSYRQINDVERFRRDYAGIPMVNRREIASVHCNEEQARCVLKQKFEAALPMMKGTLVPVYADEIWVREDGQWWIFKK